MVLKSRSKISPYILDNHDHMTPGLKYNLRYHLIRKKKMNELPSLVDAESKPKVVLFYKNGDRNFRGYHVTVTPRRFRNFDNLLNELTRITNLVQGARYVFTPDTGTRIDDLDALRDGKAYVCGSYPKLKRINYGSRPDGSARKKVPNKNFLPASNVSQAPSLHYEHDRTNLASLKPKIVTVIRYNILKPRKTVKILLNRRTAQTYDQVLNDVTSAVGVQGGSGVRKLFSSYGKLVMSLSELFEDDDIFIAVGNEKFKPSDAPVIVAESGLRKSIKMSKGVSPSPSPSKPSSTPTNKKQAIRTLKKLPEIKPVSKPNVKKRANKTPQKEISADSPNLSTLDESLKATQKGQNTEASFDKSPNGLFQAILEENKSNSETTSNVILKDEKPIEENSKAEKYSGATSDNTESSEKIKTTEKNDDKEIKNQHDSAIADMNEVGAHAVFSRESTINSNVSSLSSDSHSEKTIDNNNEHNNDKDDENNNSISANSSDTNSIETTDVNKKDIESESIVSKESSLKAENELPIIETKQNSESIESSNIMKEWYDIGKKLGDGNFAVVKEAIDKKTGEKYALKIIDALKLEGKEDMLKNEIEIQKNCLHPNIVQLYHDFHAPTEIFLVMELISGGDFFDLISENIKFEEDEASLYMRDLCSGLDYLHQRKIVHRDIKPENLMVYEKPNGLPVLKIADFGLAMKVDEPVYTICGTPTYVAPEILTEKGYGLEVDVWAAGVILYIMLCGFPPFRSPNRKQTELFDLIEAGEFEYLEPYWDDVTDVAKDLINNVLVVDVERRFTCAQILKDQWLSQFGLKRNNTMESRVERKSKTNRFKAAVRGIQSINRMKNLVEMKLERGEEFITHVSHSHQSSVLS